MLGVSGISNIIFIEVSVQFMQTADPGQMPHSATSDLDQQCLPVSFLRNAKH